MERVLRMAAWVLIFQPAPAPADGLPATAILTNAAEVRALTSEDASRSLPVRLRGVFMGQTSAVEVDFVIADQTEGIYLVAPPELSGKFNRGEVVEVEGVTDPGGFAPFVRARTMRKIGQAEIPPPRKVSLGDLSNGGLDAQWVEVWPKTSSPLRPPERSWPATPPPP
jgi:hypothetical protein